MKKQMKLFLTAVMFYTRLPVPRSLEFSGSLLNRATRYFPMIGWVVGGIGAAVFWSLHLIFPKDLAVFISMLTTIIATGAFHEDGFADFCDGFGGGYTREKRLEIMKDSRLGTYGAVGLLGMIGSKFLVLGALPASTIPLLLISGHAFSRLTPVLIIYTSNYSRKDASGKSKAVGQRGTWADLIIAAFIALFPLVWLPWQVMAAALPLALLITWLFRRYIDKHIGGYTGDCLGALQQLNELAFYLLILVLV